MGAKVTKEKMKNNFNSLGFNYRWGWTLLPIGYTVTWHLKWAKEVTNHLDLIRIRFWEFITPTEKFYLPCVPEMKSFTGNFLFFFRLNNPRYTFLAHYTFGHSHRWKVWFHFSSQFPPQLHLLNLELHLFNFVMPLEISPKLTQKMLRRNPKKISDFLKTNLFHKIHSRTHSYAFYALFCTCVVLGYLDCTASIRRRTVSGPWGKSRDSYCMNHMYDSPVSSSLKLSSIIEFNVSFLLSWK